LPPRFSLPPTPALTLGVRRTRRSRRSTSGTTAERLMGRLTSRKARVAGAWTVIWRAPWRKLSSCPHSRPPALAPSTPFALAPRTLRAIDQGEGFRHRMRDKTSGSNAAELRCRLLQWRKLTAGGERAHGEGSVVAPCCKQTGRRGQPASRPHQYQSHPARGVYLLLWSLELRSRGRPHWLDTF